MLMMISARGGVERLGEEGRGKGDFPNPQVRVCRIAGHLRSVTGKFDDDYHSSETDNAEDDCDEKRSFYFHLFYLLGWLGTDCVHHNDDDTDYYDNKKLSCEMQKSAPDIKAVTK